MRATIQSIIDHLNKHESEFKRDNWQHFDHPTAWNIDRDFNWAFLAAIALALCTAILPAIFSGAPATRSSWNSGSKTTAQFSGVTERQYEAGFGDDTAF